jgi:hypothetical protein
VSKKRGAEDFDRKDGSGKTIAWSNCILSDRSGQIRINAWRSLADVMDKQLAVGSAYLISGAEVEENRYSSFIRPYKDQIAIKTPNPKCRVYRLDIHSVMLVFSTPLVN